MGWKAHKTTDFPISLNGFDQIASKKAKIKSLFFWKIQKKNSKKNDNWDFSHWYLVFFNYWLNAPASKHCSKSSIALEKLRKINWSLWDNSTDINCKIENLWDKWCILFYLVGTSHMYILMWTNSLWRKFIPDRNKLKRRVDT